MVALANVRTTASSIVTAADLVRPRLSTENATGRPFADRTYPESADTGVTNRVPVLAWTGTPARRPPSVPSPPEGNDRISASPHGSARPSTSRLTMASVLIRSRWLNPEPSRLRTRTPLRAAHAWMTRAPALVDPPAPSRSPKVFVSISAWKLIEP